MDRLKVNLSCIRCKAVGLSLEMPLTLCFFNSCRLNTFVSPLKSSLLDGGVSVDKEVILNRIHAYCRALYSKD